MLCSYEICESESIALYTNKGVCQYRECRGDLLYILSDRMAFSVGKDLLLKLRNELQTFFHSNRKRHLKVEEVESIISLCRHLGPEHFNLSVKNPFGKLGFTSVTYQHIWESKSVSMGIFVLSPGASIPLHDHPGMTVISRILYGSLRIRSFDFAPLQSDDGLLGILRQDSTISAPSTTALSPTCGNIHEFLADGIEGCAIFDILAPPYNTEEGRDCSYYKVDEEKVSHLGKEYYRLKKYTPTDFRVQSAPYRGPQMTGT
uniref:Uncharacterized protein AlNc14C223G9151 n=1 Tax=Albugo laibachii Nc14 TaxID=890382 RepID=F0WS09_9STRA|nr:conserved hypothetical protein [Albugo laibachii Nc14]|eukprot:CCA24127.1 conserved hypothetical protein [Albugo laibachii Nc14]